MSTVTKNVISLESAVRIIDQAISEAQVKNVGIIAAVVDAGGHLIALKKMDNLSVVGPIEVSIKKARTAALFGFNSLDFGVIAQPGEPIYSIEHTNGGLISFGGGIALFEDGQLIGGLGVSGASVEEDEIIAKKAAEIFNN